MIMLVFYARVGIEYAPIDLILQAFTWRDMQPTPTRTPARVVLWIDPHGRRQQLRDAVFRVGHELP